MKPEFSKIAFGTAAVTGAVCVLVLAMLTFQSLFRLFGTQPEKEKVIPEEKAIPAVAESASPERDVKSISDAGEHPFISPAPAPAGHSVSPTTAGHADFKPDFQAIQEQEKGRHDMIENLRRQARENPEADNIPLEKQLKQIEESKADFL